MTKIEVHQLVWDNWNTQHIAKHKVLKREVELALLNVRAYRQGYKGRLIIIGRSEKRILAIVLAREKSHTYYVITARDADKKERKLVYEKEKSK